MYTVSKNSVEGGKRYPHHASVVPELARRAMSDGSDRFAPCKDVAFRKCTGQWVSEMDHAPSPMVGSGGAESSCFIALFDTPFRILTCVHVMKVLGVFLCPHLPHAWMRSNENRTRKKPVCDPSFQSHCI